MTSAPFWFTTGVALLIISLFAAPELAKRKNRSFMKALLITLVLGILFLGYLGPVIILYYLLVGKKEKKEEIEDKEEKTEEEVQREIEERDEERQKQMDRELMPGTADLEFYLGIVVMLLSLGAGAMYLKELVYIGLIGVLMSIHGIHRSRKEVETGVGKTGNIIAVFSLIVVFFVWVLVASRILG